MFGVQRCKTWCLFLFTIFWLRRSLLDDRSSFWVLKAMEMEDDGEVGTPALKWHHVKKRALKNKGVTVGFDEKDLKDFVTGFHKRKKKRRKIAQKQLLEKERVQRIEARRKRKLERELALYGGALPEEEHLEPALENEENGVDLEPEVGNVSGTKTYENNGMSITVTTTEISHDKEDLREKGFQIAELGTAGAGKIRPLPPKKKPFKRAAKPRSHTRKHKKPMAKGKGENKRKGK